MNMSMSNNLIEEYPNIDIKGIKEQLGATVLTEGMIIRHQDWMIDEYKGEIQALRLALKEIKEKVRIY